MKLLVDVRTEMTKKALKKEASSRNEISPKDIPDGEMAIL